MNINTIKKYKYVSFDLFDTLVTRLVSNPCDVFYMVEKVYLKKNISKIKNFKDKRMSAEIEARKNRKYEDITLDDIYERLLKYYSKTELKQIKELEKELEISLCLKNLKISKYYDYCVKNNIKIIINSDMYLPKEVIETILNKNGYGNNYKVYVSSDTKVLKVTSNMYKYILKDLNITEKDIIHIGDNIYVDFIVPRLNNIKAIKIPKVKKSKNKDLNVSIFENYLSLYPNKSDYFENFGYKCLGPLLYGFSYWLKESIEKSKSYNIFFLAREGKIMKECFELINDNPNINTTYMYASRRSIMVPALNKMNNKILDNIKYVKINLDTLLKSIGLNPIKYKDLASKYNFKLEDSIYLNDKNLESFIEEIKKDIYENSIEEEKCLKEYLNQINFKNKISIVDIGWFGSMQKYLNYLVSSNTTIYGYYLGLNVEENNYKKSFLFSKNRNRKLKEQKDLYSPILEVFLTADHGSTEKFKITNNEVKPIFYEYEYKNSKEFNYILSAQKNALEFIKDFNEITFGVIRLDSYSAFKNISKLGINPSKEDIEYFSDFSLYDGKRIKLIQNSDNPKNIINDFFDSTWKVGYLKSAFKFNVKIFKLINKIYYKKHKL